MSQFLRPGHPLESGQDTHSLPPPAILSHPADNMDQELPPPSPQLEYLDENDPPPPPEDSLMLELDDEDVDQLDKPGDEEDPPPSDSDSDNTSSSDLDEEDPPPPDSEEPPPPNNDEPPPPNPVEDVRPITREDMKLSMEFVRMLEEAVLESQFRPDELETFLNPQPLSFSPSDDPDLLLSISNYVANLNASEDIYIKNRLNLQRWCPDIKILSYEQVKRTVSSLSGVLTWQDDMCIDSCAGFMGPYARLEECPRCHKPRYDPEILAKSGGMKKVRRKAFMTLPVGPQLQSHLKSPGMAQKMHYRRDKTPDILKNRNLAEGFVSLVAILATLRMTTGEPWGDLIYPVFIARLALVPVLLAVGTW